MGTGSGGENIHPDDNGPYIRLWRHMYQYFTETKGLNNLIWVYASSTYNGESWKAPVDFYYPGGDVVDIVALDVYDDDVNAHGYEELLALGKPFAMAEVGPLASRDGSYDNLYMLQQMLERYPETIYFLTWHGWMENGIYQHLPVAHHQNASALMNHECVTTLDEMSIDTGSGTEQPRSDKLLIPYGVPSPVIDGVVDDIWSKVPSHSINNQLLGSQTAADLSGQFRMMYDRSNVYLLVEVQDDLIRSNSGADWWEDDGIEIYIDADLSGGESWDGVNDYLLGFRVGDPEAKVGGFSAEMPSSLTFNQRIAGGGYVMEIKIPLAVMGYDRSNGGRFGFDIHINDDDDTGGRDGKVSWFATVDDSWQRPASFGVGYPMDRVVYLPIIRR